MRASLLALAIGAIGLTTSLAAYAAGDYSAWTQAVRVGSIPGTHPDFNGAALDGCPFVSREERRSTWERP